MQEEALEEVREYVDDALLRAQAESGEGGAEGSERMHDMESHRLHHAYNATP